MTQNSRNRVVSSFSRFDVIVSFNKLLHLEWLEKLNSDLKLTDKILNTRSSVKKIDSDVADDQVDRVA